MIPLWEQRDDLLSENANLIIEWMSRLDDRGKYLLVRSTLKEHSVKQLKAMNEHLRKQVKDE